MATQALTNTPSLLTLMPGSSLAFTNSGASTATVSFGYTSAGASSGPVIASIPPSAPAPAIPASAVAAYNANAEPVSVAVTGGTISAVTVNGAAVGITGPFVVPPYGNIVLTYSVVPTSWAWTGLGATVMWTWPGIFINFGVSSLYLVASVASGVSVIFPT